MSNGLQRFKKNKYSPYRKQILFPDAVFKPRSETKQHRWPSYIALHSALSSKFNGFRSLRDNVSTLALNGKKIHAISPANFSSVMGPASKGTPRSESIHFLCTHCLKVLDEWQMLSSDAKLRGLSCKRYNRNSCQKPFPSRSKQSKGSWKGSLAITTGTPQRPSVSKAAAQRTLPLAADRINAL